MSRTDRFTRTAERARKAFAYSVAREAEAKGQKAERKASRLARIERKAYLAAMRAADLDAYSVEG